MVGKAIGIYKTCAGLRIKKPRRALVGATGRASSYGQQA